MRLLHTLHLPPVTEEQQQDEGVCAMDCCLNCTTPAPTAGAYSSSTANVLSLACHDYTIRLYDIQAPGFPLRQELRYHTQKITAIATNPTQPHVLVSAQEDGIIVLYDTRQGRLAQSVAMPSLVRQHNQEQQQHLLAQPALQPPPLEGEEGGGHGRKEGRGKGNKGVYGNTLDFNSYDAKCCCIALAPHDGNLLASSWGTDIHVMDLRQLPSFTAGPRQAAAAAPPQQQQQGGDKFAYSVDRLHTDEITALQFINRHQLCSAGEDLMVNFVDLHEKEDDMLLAATRCGEVGNRMHYFESCQGVGIVGSCENAYWFPTADVTAQREDKIERPDFASYMVDWFQLPAAAGGAPSAPYLVRGVRDDDGNAGPLEVLNYATKETAVLPTAQVHREMTRVVLGISADAMVTASEDGVVAFWHVGETDGPGGAPYATAAPPTSYGPEMTSRDGGHQTKRLRL